jgi:dimethylamine monooxygenase subunit A
MDDPIFRDGPPRFDVGLKPIALDKWLLPDDQAHWLPAKNDLLDRQPKAVFGESPGSQAGQTELAGLISEVAKTPMNDTDPALMACARLVSDDLVILKSEAGAWRVIACCLCSPTFFTAPYALGKTLAELHGPVPDGDFGLSARIARVFTGLSPTMILERHNWTVQWSDARYTPDGQMLRDAAEQAPVTQAANNLFLRVERQTIRKLAVTGMIVFTIRIRLTKLHDIVADEQARAAFASAWVGASAPVRTYKKWAVLERHVEHLLSER